MGIENTELASLPDYQINISFFQKYPHTKIEKKKTRMDEHYFCFGLGHDKGIPLTKHIVILTHQPFEVAFVLFAC